MAACDNRDSVERDNMLRYLTRAAEHGLAYNSLCRVQSAMSSIKSRNIYISPTSAYKQKLLKLPVPKLKETLDKYLQSLLPITSEDELCETKCLIKEFAKPGGCGAKLQKLLEQKAECSHNWLEKWWLEAAYLGYRIPVVVHSSPGLVFPLQKFCNKEQRLDYAARLIIASLKYKKLIDDEKIPIEKSGKDELDMQQYKKFFGTCRIPKSKVDGLEFNPKSRHIVVASNNHFYKLYPIDDCNNILNINQIVGQLSQILENTCEKAPAIGILSSDHRDVWANTYKMLIETEKNDKSVHEIQTSLFLVCLDQAPEESSCSNRLTVAGGQLIHGGGIDSNSGNRWFDKTVQFVVGADGIVGMTYEHSPSEGQPIALMTDYIVSNMEKIDPCGEGASEKCVELLDFCVDKDLKKAIKNSGETLDSLICNFDLDCQVFKDFGKTFIKKEKMSPDSFLQMAMQFAYYRTHCEPAVHYESAATRKYLGGRTETIRSCSVESIAFAEGMLDCNLKPMEKRKLMEAAVNSHKKYTTDAVNGFGVDRHFLGLQKIAAENCIELPDFFSDPAFIRSKHFNISSSQVATKCAGFMCYGAVQPDGYGICYNPRDNDLYYGISCFNEDEKTSAKKLAKNFNKSLNDMHDVLVKAPKAKI